MIAAATLGSIGVLAGAAAGPWLFGLLGTATGGGIGKLDSLIQLMSSGGIGIIALGTGIKLFGVKLRPSK